jgi:malate dehydrogenase (oxaloacetate-decarboxylating)
VALPEKQVRILRAMIRDEPGHIGMLTQAIGDGGAGIGDIVKVRTAGEYNVRELELYIDSEDQLRLILERVALIDGIRVEAVYDPVLELHRSGKIRMRSTVSIERIGDIRKIYTPGVATVCNEIQAHPEKVYDYTALGKTVAIVTNGTAVLGLGNIGVHAGLPVMEGKAALLDRLVGLSGVPILIPSRDPETFIDTVIQIAPSFGAIQIEDVAAPECFEIEQRLIDQLPIPVMHDDQHGTAVVCLAALLNAMQQTGLQLDRLCIGLLGLGAAGIGITKLLISYGVKDLAGSDINREAARRFEALGGHADELRGVMARAQVVIATTGRAGLIEPEMIREGQIVFALSNPVPEIEPGRALEAGAAFAVDGRSVNNALGFPGIFLGALDARTRRITDAMKVAAAETIAQFAEPGELVPSLLHADVHHAVAEAVQEAAELPDPGERA